MPAGRYGAESPSLFGNVGGPLAPRYNVDVPEAIDRLAQGTGSVIHNIYMRRQAANQQKIAQQHWDTQAKWHEDEIARQREHDTIEQQRYERDSHRQDLINGITPPKTTTEVTEGTPATLPSTSVGMSPIKAAMGTPPVSDVGATPGAGAITGPLPSVEQAANNAEPPATVNRLPQPQLSSTTTPETYDPTKALSYQRMLDAGNVRAQAMRDVANTRAAGQMAAREYAADAATKLAKLKADLAVKGKMQGGIGKAMTGNAMELAREHAAIGLIDKTNGSYDDAVAILNADDETGKSLRAQGIEPRHLMYAHAQFTKGGVTAATRLQGSAMASPEESVNAVNTTRRLVGAGAKGGAATSTAPAPSRTLTPPNVGGAASVAGGGEPTDAELAAALAAGIKPTDAAGARAWIAQQRAKRAKK